MIGSVNFELIFFWMSSVRSQISQKKQTQRSLAPQCSTNQLLLQYLRFLQGFGRHFFNQEVAFSAIINLYLMFQLYHGISEITNKLLQELLQLMLEVHTPVEEGLKCPTCLVSFSGMGLYQDHYKSDFHRYNIKRKMVKLAPVTQDQFKAKKAEVKTQETLELKCHQCGKKFNSTKTLNQHALSKNHKISKSESTGETEHQPKKHQKKVQKYVKNSKVCLFCLEQSNNLHENMAHMSKSHSFFIAQPKFCVDKQGLIEYLQEKIQVGFMCITCDNKKAKDFNSGTAVRKHMNDKGHNFMKIEDGYEEYEKFYDFSELFKQLVESQKGRQVPGIQYTEVKVYADDDKPKQQNNQSDSEDWEDEEDSQNQDEEWQSDEDGSQEIKEKQDAQEQIKQKASKKKIKKYMIMKPTVTGNDELLLPNGKILGHRKYRHIYQQNYQAPTFLNHLKMLTNTETASINNAIISRQKMIEIMRHEKLLERNQLNHKKKHLRVGMNQNLIIRRYFRCQNSL